MWNNNYGAILANKKAEEEARKESQDKRIAESGDKARREITADFEAGKQLGEEILGDGLGRIQDDADVQASEDLMRQRAIEGYSETEENAMRDKGLQQIQGAERKASRGLSASLARSGVRGGAAGQMQVELAAQNVNNRRQFETDLILSDEQVKRKAETDFANFSTKLAEFDLAQAAKEKNIVLQTQLATAQLGSTERGATQNAIAQEEAARASKRSCFPAGTMVKMADESYKAIQDIGIGEETYKGGKVTGVHQFKNTEVLYNLNGVLVTGAHAALHNGLFSRVEDIEEAVKTTSRPDVVYSLSTVDHRLVIGGDVFADYAETDLDVNDFESLFILNRSLKKAS